jgi:hypothetical protein
MRWDRIWQASILITSFVSFADWRLGTECLRERLLGRASFDQARPDTSIGRRRRGSR